MKDSARYVKIVEWSEEDNCYVVLGEKHQKPKQHIDNHANISRIPQGRHAGLLLISSTYDGQRVDLACDQ